MSNGTGTHILTQVERQILNAIQDLRFGSVEIVVHDSRVVQVETREKVRFDAPVAAARPDVLAPAGGGAVHSGTHRARVSATRA
jgi:hypothetical protein